MSESQIADSVREAVDEATAGLRIRPAWPGGPEPEAGAAAPPAACSPSFPPSG